MTAAKRKGVVSARPDSGALLSTQVLKSAVAAAPVAISFTRGPDHRVEFANPAFVRLSGRGELGVVGHSFAAVLPDVSVTATRMLDRVYATGDASSSVDHERRIAGHRVRYLRCTAWTQPDDHERARGLVVLVQDITPQAVRRRVLETRTREQCFVNERFVLASVREHEHAESAERKAAHFGALVGSLTEGVIVLDATGHVLVLNGAAREILGIVGDASVEDLLNVDTRRLDGTRMPIEERPSARALRGEPTDRLECVVMRPDRQERRVVVTATSVPDVENDSRLVLVVLRDVTELRQAERLRDEAFDRSESLRMLGQMAAGIAHDIANLLNPISLNTQLITRALEAHDTERGQRALADTRAILERALDTLESLRDFATHRPEARMQPLDLVDLAREAMRIARPRMAAHRLSRVVEDFAETRLVEGQATDIVRALVNLVCNAIDAMRGGGVITLRSGNDGEGAWIEVADNGPGMPDDVRRHAFDAFFTTKGQNGTGMGLAMVKDCVDRHRGYVAVDSSPGRGTRIKLWFPAIHAEHRRFESQTP